jgi:predicted nucleic acid-binding protein
MKKVFVDTNIILDLLAERNPFYHSAAKLFSLADSGKIKIYVSSLSFATVNYLLAKEKSNSEARKIIGKFKVLVSVLGVDDKIIELSLNSNFSDFEDAIQYFTAIENNIKIIITRNIKDFKHSEIPVMNADGFLKSL